MPSNRGLRCPIVDAVDGPDVEWIDAILMMRPQVSRPHGRNSKPDGVKRRGQIHCECQFPSVDGKILDREKVRMAALLTRMSGNKTESVATRSEALDALLRRNIRARKDRLDAEIRRDSGSELMSLSRRPPAH